MDPKVIYCAHKLPLYSTDDEGSGEVLLCLRTKCISLYEWDSVYEKPGFKSDQTECVRTCIHTENGGEVQEHTIRTGYRQL
jgi:hypothetical protein